MRSRVRQKSKLIFFSGYHVGCVIAFWVAYVNAGDERLSA